MKYLFTKNLLLLFSLLIFNSSYSQVVNPVQFKHHISSNKDGLELHLIASLKKGWHLYSQTTPDGGPFPTTISFAKNPLVELEGTVMEVGKLEKRYEDLFGVEVKQYSDKVEFIQKLKLKSKVKTSLNFNIQYMTCNDAECLPPKTESFSTLIR